MIRRQTILTLVSLIISLMVVLSLWRWNWLEPFDAFVPVNLALAPTRASETQPTQQARAASATPRVLIGAGDISVCGLDGDNQTAALLKHLLLRYPGATVFTAGDNVQINGEMFEYKDCFGPSWGWHRGVIRPSPGNHDWYIASGEAYFSYFEEAAGPPGLGYYSYDVGDWHIVSLNSNCDTHPCDEDSAQVQWLRADLQNNPSLCTLLYWHHPLWSSGLVPISQAGEAFWRAAYESGAEIVVNGHDHHYERLALLDQDGRLDPARGMRLCIAGTGGAWLFEIGDPLTVTEALDNHNLGLLVFFLYPDRYEWQFVPVEQGGYTDFGSGVCRS